VVGGFVVEFPNCYIKTREIVGEVTGKSVRRWFPTATQKSIHRTIRKM